ncbi:unnamed protein product [Urochloa humidicola]
MGDYHRKRKAVCTPETYGTPGNESQLETYMQDSQPQSFISEFHLPSPQKIRRKFLIVPHTSSTSAGGTIPGNDCTSTTFIHTEQSLQDDHCGAFIDGQTNESEISMDNSQLQTVPSTFHLPSRRKIRRELMFMPGCAPTSIGPNVLCNDSSACSSVNQLPLADEARPAHSEDGSCPTYLISAAGHRKRKAPMSLHRSADSNIAGPSDLSKYACRRNSPDAATAKQHQHKLTTNLNLASTSRHQRLLSLLYQS